MVKRRKSQRFEDYLCPRLQVTDVWYIKQMVPKLAVLVVIQGCREFLYTGLQLRNESQIIPMVSDVCAFYFEHTVQLKSQLWQQCYIRHNRKNLHIIGREKEGCRQLYYTILGCCQRGKCENQGIKVRLPLCLLNNTWWRRVREWRTYGFHYFL
jgi:hypothetical protein